MALTAKAYDNGEAEASIHTLVNRGVNDRVYPGHLCTTPRRCRPPGLHRGFLEACGLIALWLALVAPTVGGFLVGAAAGGLGYLMVGSYGGFARAAMLVMICLREQPS
jgi:hypothetical protein